MKISELNNKSFLGAPGAATNSYVLINYEDNTTNEPVTYKATLDELGKSIASNLKLFKSSSSVNMNDAACLLDVNNGAYSERKAYPMVSQSEIDMIHAAQSEGDVHNIVDGIMTSQNCVSYIDDMLLDNNSNPIPYLLTVDPSTNGLYYYDENGYETTYGEPVMKARPVYAVFGSVENGKAECRLISTIDKNTVATLSTFMAEVMDSTVQPSESEY